MKLDIEELKQLAAQKVKKRTRDLKAANDKEPSEAELRKALEENTDKISMFVPSEELSIDPKTGKLIYGKDLNELDIANLTELELPDEYQASIVPAKNYISIRTPGAKTNLLINARSTKLNLLKLLNCPVEKIDMASFDAVMAMASGIDGVTHSIDIEYKDGKYTFGFTRTNDKKQQKTLKRKSLNDLTYEIRDSYYQHLVSMQTAHQTSNAEA